jgi:hypothetical protein
MSQLAASSRWLAKTMAKHNSSGSESGRTITYIRGTQRIVIAATPGDSEIEVTDDDGQLTVRRVRDFKVNAEELVVDGQVFEPSLDDQILEEFITDTTTTRWLHDIVKLPGKGTYDWCDHHRIRMRVFTERSATQASAAP